MDNIFSPLIQSSLLIYVKKIFLSYPGSWGRQATRSFTPIIVIVFYCCSKLLILLIYIHVLAVFLIHFKIKIYRQYL
jgi:hypothetical protein